MALGSDITTVSILDLLATAAEIPADALSRAARSFAAKLASGVPTDTLTYIVPDATDEFALGTLRRSINAAFRAAEPLPRSVATVFAWQSSDRFSVVNDGDCVIVFDTVGNTLSATPLLARSHDHLARRLPESMGICWERYPTVGSDLGATSTKLAMAMLEQAGCPDPAEPARLFGHQGLADEGSELSWQGHDGAWFTPPHRRDQSARSALYGGFSALWRAFAHALDHEPQSTKKRSAYLPPPCQRASAPSRRAE